MTSKRSVKLRWIEGSNGVLEVNMEIISYIILAFFFGYAIGKIRGSNEIFDEWDKYIQDHTIYNQMTNKYELR